MFRIFWTEQLLLKKKEKQKQKQKHNKAKEQYFHAQLVISYIYLPFGFKGYFFKIASETSFIETGKTILCQGKDGLRIISGNNLLGMHLTEGYHSYELPEG